MVRDVKSALQGLPRTMALQMGSSMGHAFLVEYKELNELDFVRCGYIKALS